MNTTIDTTELDFVLGTLREQALSGEITLDQLRWYSNLTREQRDALMEDEEEDEDDDEQDQAPIDILRPILSSLTLAATDGTETIPNAASVFTGYIDPDFRNWGADEASGPTAETPVVVHEMVKDTTFAQMFGSLGVPTEQLCMTQSQIIRFCQDHRQHLRTGGYATFFLFKSRGKFFVAVVYFRGDGRLEVGVCQFEYDLVWYADRRRRVVVPQLEHSVP
ncbi:MAG TPA: hypothetical protein VLG69_01855 [Candidatus Andersenbacteria bacterium]|nr:hypothetical protein [Candidatus Andersenbacteria bacterium]